MSIQSNVSEATEHKVSITNKMGDLTNVASVETISNDNTKIKSKCESIYDRGKLILSSYLTVGERDSEHIEKIGIAFQKKDEELKQVLEGGRLK